MKIDGFLNVKFLKIGQFPMKTEQKPSLDHKYASFINIAKTLMDK